MKSKIDEKSQRILVLLKLDSKRVFERIKYRETEYLAILSIKRTRDHFPAIFDNRYDACKIDELIHCGQEVLVGLDQFYSKVDEMRWYLNTTNDMPAKIEDKVHVHIRELESYYEMLNLYINVELGISEATSIADEPQISVGDLDFSSQSDDSVIGPDFGSSDSDFSEVNLEFSSDSEEK